MCTHAQHRKGYRADGQRELMFLTRHARVLPTTPAPVLTHSPVASTGVVNPPTSVCLFQFSYGFSGFLTYHLGSISFTNANLHVMNLKSLPSVFQHRKPTSESVTATFTTTVLAEPLFAPTLLHLQNMAAAVITHHPSPTTHTGRPPVQLINIPRLPSHHFCHFLPLPLRLSISSFTPPIASHE